MRIRELPSDRASKGREVWGNKGVLGPTDKKEHLMDNKNDFWAQTGSSLKVE